MISLEHLNKVFRSGEVETTALCEVNLNIGEGDFVAIMGPSGCGKSTLLNIIGLLDNPTAGSYKFWSEEISKYGERKLASLRKKMIAFVFQSFNLIDELSVFANVELPLVYQGIARGERMRRVDAALDKMGILSRRKHFPHQLSGGQQQRVALARAVIGEPTLILADEPTGNLDSANGEDVMKVLAHLNSEGATIVMVTHSQPHALHAQRTIRMLDGRVLAENTIIAGNV